MFHKFILSIFLFSLCIALGCNKSTVKRCDVAGTVTWNGQAIKSGYITFNPDGKKGNRGPQGFAIIKNGKFDTRFTGGRGVSPGAQVMEVSGYDGGNATDSLGKLLFTDYKKYEMFDKENLEFNFDIPKGEVVIPVN
jgi:hypothetical protein